MQAITLDQSAMIGVEIFQQTLTLQVIACEFKPPWGALQKERYTRLCRARGSVLMPKEGDTIILRGDRYAR
jgi:hypothetical protein